MSGLLMVQPCVSQEYPFWFLFQGEVRCGKTAVGFANPSLYSDSAVALSIKLASESYRRQSAVKITGGESFWATEGGTYWMGNDFTEEYDTSKALDALPDLSALDTITTSKGVFVLLGESGCDASPIRGKKYSVAGKAPPAWTEKPPSDRTGLYAVGAAPEYYYETSSGAEAERNARRNLARMVRTNVKSLQKVTASEGQDVRNEELSVILRGIQVVARWRDVKRQIFYVLLKMPVD